MRFSHKIICAGFLAGLLLAASQQARAADILYNFNFELTNTSGGDYLATGTFSSDPSQAMTGSGMGPLGEPFQSPIDTLALTVFSLGSAPFTDSSINYSVADATSPALAWFTSYNLSTGTTDPVFTVSAPDSAGFLTVELNGVATEIFQGATLGSTSGTPLVSGPGTIATSFDASPIPEPASIVLTLSGLAAAAFFRKRRSL